MENSTTIVKDEIALLLQEFTILIKLCSDKVKDYLKDAYYFQDIKELINDKDMNMFNKVNFEYFNLAKEFRNFVLRYNVSHDHIRESVLNDIVKRPVEYILHRKQSEYDSESDSDDDESDDDKDNNSTIDNNLQSMINNISEEKTISNNLKQLLIDNLLKQSIINDVLKNSAINNKELLIDDILNKKTIDNEKVINNNINKTINNEQLNNEKTINNEKNDNNENTFVETPMCIKSKRAVLNPKSNNNKSFQYSITLSLCYKEIGNNFNRITKIKPYINNFNWNNVKFSTNKTRL